TTTDSNGVYQMQLDERTRNVYITVPAAYKIPQNESLHIPQFYSKDKIDVTKVNRNDFSLEPLPEPETEFTLVMVGDPQCQTSKGVGYFPGSASRYFPSLRKMRTWRMKTDSDRQCAAPWNSCAGTA
ncbi:MAG: hypothetical protein II640_10515, partial [Lachnospiraceae bacterium]|nr:hypothetical protein [Lachnospiraceae bacterium]